MVGQFATAKPESIEFRAVVSRCSCVNDSMRETLHGFSHQGKLLPCPKPRLIEDKGVISSYYRSRFKRLMARFHRHGSMAIVDPASLIFVIGMATVFSNSGKAITTNRITGAGTEPVNAGWGTGAGTAAATDTTLFTETDTDLSTTSGTRASGTSSRQTTSVTNDTWRLVQTITATGAGTVTNAGCFDGTTIGSNNLMVKGDFTGIGLASGDAIQFTINLAFA